MLTIVGLDLGQAQDYTALCVVEARGTRHEARVPVVRYSHLLGGYGETTERHEYEGPPVSFAVRYLERFALGTRYPAIVGRVGVVRNRLERFLLVVDATGVGAPVLDSLRQAGLDPIGIVITGGDSVSISGDLVHVPKRDLVSVVQVALQNERLKVAEALPLAGVLAQELLAFRVAIDPRTAHDTYNAREGEHDDLVLAVALACWLGHAFLSAPQTIRQVVDLSAW